MMHWFSGLPLAQAQNLMFFEAEGGSQRAYLMAFAAIFVGLLLVFAMFNTPIRLRRPIIVAVTFLAGAFYFLSWLWPIPIGYEPGQKPLNGTEAFGLALQDGTTVMGKILQVIQGILLFLGVYSVLRVHAGRFVKKQKDWAFSLVLLLSMMTMIIFGYAEYIDNVRSNGAHSAVESWTIWQYGKDFLFDGMLQNMDAAMFSIIAFFILSAAYRAFRIRSIESTILLTSALIMILALMGLAEYGSTQVINGMTGGDPSHFANNFSLTSVRIWIRDNLQGPSIRALEWGIFIGGLAMGIRLWLSLERSGGGS